MYFASLFLVFAIECFLIHKRPFHLLVTKFPYIGDLPYTCMYDRASKILGIHPGVMLFHIQSQNNKSEKVIYNLFNSLYMYVKR